MAKVSANVAAADRDLCEATLVDTAIDCDPNFLGNAAQRILDRVDPDGNIDDTTPASKMEFHFGTRSTRTGLTPIKGQLDDHGVEVVKKAIDALSAPRPDGCRDADGDAVQDPRPAANRRAHGLIEALGRYLDAGIGPIQGGERPHVTITMNWDALTGLISNASFDSGAMISPAQARRFLCDAQVIPMILGSNPKSSTWGGRPARSRRTSAGPSPPEIRDALGRAAIGRPTGATPTTSNSGGGTSGTPVMPTGVCSVRIITQRFTNSNGSSRSRRTAHPSSSRRVGLIRCNDHAATPYENSTCSDGGAISK